MIEEIESFDQELMLYLNGMHNDFMDVVMHYVSESWVWIPVFAFMIRLVWKNQGTKAMWLLIGTALLSVLLSDRISVELFKEVFQRYRPCHNLEIGDMIHTVYDKCGGKYGFVSSHATNFFSLAVLFSLVGRRYIKSLPYWLILWAALIGYSRIYLGVHYPADVACGSILGTLIGLFTYQVFKYVERRWILTS